LKQWDSGVFGSEIRSTSDEVLSALKRHSSIAQHQKHSDSNFLRKNRGPRWRNERFRNSNNLDHENSISKGVQDSLNKNSRLTGPPEHKVIKMAWNYYHFLKLICFIPVLFSCIESYKCIFLCVNSEAFMVTLLIKAILILVGTFYCGFASYHMHLQHLCSF